MKKMLLVFTILNLIFFTSCEKDDSDITVKNNEKNILVEDILGTWNLVKTTHAHYGGGVFIPNENDPCEDIPINNSFETYFNINIELDVSHYGDDYYEWLITDLCGNWSKTFLFTTVEDGVTSFYDGTGFTVYDVADEIIVDFRFDLEKSNKDTIIIKSIYNYNSERNSQNLTYVLTKE